MARDDDDTSFRMTADPHSLDVYTTLKIGDGREYSPHTDRIKDRARRIGTIVWGPRRVPSFQVASDELVLSLRVMTDISRKLEEKSGEVW